MISVKQVGLYMIKWAYNDIQRAYNLYNYITIVIVSEETAGGSTVFQPGLTDPVTCHVMWVSYRKEAGCVEDKVNCGYLGI